MEINKYQEEDQIPMILMIQMTMMMNHQDEDHPADHLEDHLEDRLETRPIQITPGILEDQEDLTEFQEEDHHLEALLEDPHLEALEDQIHYLTDYLLMHKVTMMDLSSKRKLR